MRVNFNNATRLHEALTKVGSPSILIPVTDGGHGFYSPEIDRRMGQFFDMHLRGIKADISSEPVTPVARP